MKQATLTLSQFAHDLGAHARITQAVSLVWHKQYVKASAATRQAMREEFMTHFISGMLECNAKQAMRILITPNGERTETQRKAYQAASQKFLYHISRTGAKTEQPKQPSVRIAGHLRTAAMTFLAEFDGESLEDQLRQALIVLRSL